MKTISLPKSFLNRMKNVLGSEYDEFLQCFTDNVPVSLRINPLKPISQFDKFDNVNWCKFGKYLPERPDFVFDPLIHAGCYYVQEASSMLFANAIDFSKDLKILDLCASPGGKSSLLLSKMSPNSLLISNELVKKRASILYENLCKWGNLQSIVCSEPVNAFSDFQGYFDVVVVDAPCSGEGMFRKEPELIREWTENKAFVCSITQKNILDEAIWLLKPDGLLIYMTCTFSLEENEQIVEWISQKYHSVLRGNSVNFNPEWGIKKVKVGNNEVYRSYHHHVKGEGLFLATFKVRNQKLPSVSKKHFDIFKPLTAFEKQKISVFINTEYLNNAVKLNEKVIVLPNKHFFESAAILKKMNTLKCGVFAGSFNSKSAEFIPSHELAMSLVINKSNFQRIELNRMQALHYLKKMDIPDFQDNTYPNGWLLATFEGHILGWMKKSQNRLNNLYPKEWVIRKNIMEN